MKKNPGTLLKQVGLSLCVTAFLTAAGTDAFSVSVSAGQVSEIYGMNYYVFPDSSVRLLTAADIAPYSSSDLRIAKNEIYARHGRLFQSSDLQKYFNQMIWYNGYLDSASFDNSLLNSIEVQNVSFLETASTNGSADQKASLVPFLSSMSATGYLLLPDSAVRNLTEADLAAYSTSDLRVAKNEIFARHGRTFSSADLQTYFQQMPWYNGTIAPDAFSHSVFNAYEAANVKFLDNYISSGAADHRTSFIPASYMSSTSVQTPAPQTPTTPAQVTLSGTEAYIIDSLGIGRDTRQLSGFFYDFDLSQLSDTSYQRVLSRYHHKESITLRPFAADENDEIIGNHGLQNNDSYFDEGEQMGYFNGSLYKEVLISSEAKPIATTSGLYDAAYLDTYGLEVDGKLLLTITVPSDHASGSRTTIEWMITDDIIYASTYGKAMAFAHDGTLLAETDQLSFLAAADDRYVYGVDHPAGNLIQADRKTLGNISILAPNVYHISGRTAGDLSLLYYSADYGYERFFYDSRLATMAEAFSPLQQEDWHNLSLDGCATYDVFLDYAAGKTTISVCTDPLGNTWQPLLEIEGISTSCITGVDGGYLFLSASLPEDWHYRRTDGKPLNTIHLAIHLYDQTIAILGAGWYS